MGDEGLVNLLEATSVHRVELVESIANVALDSSPTGTQELRCEAIGPGAFPVGIFLTASQIASSEKG